PPRAGQVDGQATGQPCRRDGDRRVDFRVLHPSAAQKNALKPWQKRSWCIPKVTGEFVARMEDVLELYAEPLDASRPVVCMDELSKELHGEVSEPIGPEPGHPAKEDYEYTRNGTANVFLLISPLLASPHLSLT